MVGATNYWNMIIQLRPYLFQVSLIHLKLGSDSVFTGCCCDLSSTPELVTFPFTGIVKSQCTRVDEEDFSGATSARKCCK